MLKEGAIVKLEGMDPEMAESVAQSIETVLNRYPSVKDAFDGFTTDDTGEKCFENGTAMAAFVQSTQLIHMNNKYFGNKAEFEKTYAGTVERQFHPAGTEANSVVVHEMGHAIDQYVSEKTIPKERYIWNGERVSRRIWNNAIDASKKAGTPMTGLSITAELSRYASKSAGEYLAEGFSEFVMSSNPRPLATKIGKRVEQYIRKAEKAGE